MTNKIEMMREVFEHDKQTSIGLGVPSHLYVNEVEFIDWQGKFKATISNRNFNMVLTPSTLIINDSDPRAPVLQIMGSEWLNSELGRIFHASYHTSQLDGGVQIFRTENGKPFQGFENAPHTHILVYTDGSGQKTYVPIVIDFAKN